MDTSMKHNIPVADININQYYEEEKNIHFKLF